MPKVTILSSHQIKMFDVPPILSLDEQETYFGISLTMSETIDTLRYSINKVMFVLSFGYFKYTGRFFPIETYNKGDIDYVSSMLSINPDSLNWSDYRTNRTQYRIREIILKKLGIKPFSKSSKLISVVTNMVRHKQHPKSVFYGLCDYLRSNRIEIPSYSVLHNLIAVLTLKHERTILKKVHKNINVKHKDALDILLERDDKYAENEMTEQKRYKIGSLKKPKQSIRFSVVKKTIKDFKLLKHIFNETFYLIKELNLSPNVIEYYAKITVKSDVSKILSRSDNRKYLHLLCFVIHQYSRFQDTLIDILIKSVQKTLNQVAQKQIEKSFEKRKADYTKLERIIKLSKDSDAQLYKIKELIESENISDSDKINTIKIMFAENDEKQSIFQKELTEVETYANHIRKDKLFYDILEQKAIPLQRKLNEIIKVLDFDENNSEKKLITALNHFEQREKTLSKDAPISFLDKKEQDLVFDSNTGKLKRPLYKALLFIDTAKSLKSGSINLKNSYKYQSLDNYLISKEEWDKSQKKLLKDAGLVDFSDIEKVIQSLDKELEHSFKICNKNIINSRNEYASFVNGKLNLKTPKVEKTNTIAMKELFPKSHYTSLLEILFSVNSFSGFLNNINHYQHKYTKDKPSQWTFFAAIMSYGCNIGTSKMTKISRNISKKELMNVVNWYLTPENIEVACNQILRKMSELDLLNIFKKDEGINHTSSDGQKYSIDKESLNSNYSYKYFGHKPGVSVDSFIDESHRLFYSTVISSSEREAAYVIDGLMNNDIVKSDIHSTDTHGYSEIIFGISHLLNISFAPRIKNLKDQHLYSIRQRKHYIQKNYPIVPKEKVNQNIIIKEWDNVLRLASTIKLKRCSASQIFKRLSSYSKQHPLYRAIKSFGRIIKSIFILKYINDVELRHAIEKQLNKIESLHRLAKVVFFGNNQEFNYPTKEEQEIVEGCKRLIEICIICWNYLYLSQLLSGKSDDDKITTLNIIRNGSILVWHHINVLGEYDFSDDKIKDNIGFDFDKVLKLRIA